jgi:hypothetical protein
VIDENDRLPVFGSKFLVDPRGFTQRLILQSLVSGQLAACGSRHLQKGDTTASSAILLEHGFECEEALDDALGEIPALHAKSQANIAADAVPRAHRFT